MTTTHGHCFRVFEKNQKISIHITYYHYCVSDESISGLSIFSFARLRFLSLYITHFQTLSYYKGTPIIFCFILLKDF